VMEGSQFRFRDLSRKKIYKCEDLNGAKQGLRLEVEGGIRGGRKAPIAGVNAWASSRKGQYSG